MAEEDVIKGTFTINPDVYVLPTGCAFHPRCPDAMNICAKEEPLMSGQVQHVYRCWLARKEASL